MKYKHSACFPTDFFFKKFKNIPPFFLGANLFIFFSILFSDDTGEICFVSSSLIFFFQKPGHVPMD